MKIDKIMPLLAGKKCNETIDVAFVHSQENGWEIIPDDHTYREGVFITDNGTRVMVIDEMEKKKAIEIICMEDKKIEELFSKMKEGYSYVDRFKNIAVDCLLKKALTSIN